MTFTKKECQTKNGKIFRGLYEIEPVFFNDTRGYLLETYNILDFERVGLTMKFVQDNQSKSSKGVLRGLHFQKHHPQGKLIRSLEGSVYDVAVDLRKDSSTYACYYGIILDSDRQNMIYVPEGFAHGFAVLSETAIISYKCTDIYHPEDEDGIMWNDPLINVNWSEICGDIEPLLSDKDRKHPLFKYDEDYFDKDGVWIK